MAQELIQEFDVFLTSVQVWLERYLSTPGTSLSEQKTAESLLRYIFSARRYVRGIKPNPSEIQRMRRKIENIRWHLHLAWLESGRR